MKNFLLVFLLISSFAVISSPAFAISREEALRKLDACVHSKTGRECEKVKVAEEALTRLYRQGDKSLLPVLMEATWMGDLYAEAALDDTAAYLSALSSLARPRQQAVELNMAGGMMGLPRARFLALQSALLQIPDNSPDYGPAQDSLRQLDVANAHFLITYFPPQVFNGRGAEFQTAWYSRELYALDQAPLWPPAANQHLYRFTMIPAFGKPLSISLQILPNGMGEIHLRSSNHVRVILDQTRTLTAEQMYGLLAMADQVGFWQMPVESDRRGFDGAEWIIEGVHDGQYHLVTRWSPEKSAYHVLGAAFMKLSGYTK